MDQNINNSHKVNLIIRLRDGRLVSCSQRIPIANARRVTVAIEDAVIAAGGVLDHSTIDTRRHVEKSRFWWLAFLFVDWETMTTVTTTPHVDARLPLCMYTITEWHT